MKAAPDRRALHRSSEGQLAYQRVSDLSLWLDEEWTFDLEYPSQPPSARRIHWPRDIAPSLLNTARRLVWSLRVDPPQGHLRHKNYTSVMFASRLFVLLRWMAEPRNSYEYLSEIDAAAADYYRNDVAERYQRRHEKGASAKALYAFLEPITLSFRQRSKVPDSVQVEPFGGLSAFQAARKLSKQEPGWIPYIPDDIAGPVLAQLVEWIDFRSKDIIALQRARSAVTESGAAGKNKTAAYNKLVRDFVFSAAPDTRKAWHPKLTDITQINQLVSALQHACGSLIMATTGIRVHELLSLDCKCVVVEPSTDGLFEIFYLKGVTAKLEQGAREVRWAAGARPKGGTDVPWPVRATEVMFDLHRDLRATSGHTALFLTAHSCHLQGTVARRHTPPAFTKYYNAFYSRWVKTPRPWRFTTHQWRKTFARFVLRNDRTALSALSSHFKHVSIAMTDRGYLGAAWQAWDLTEYMNDVAKMDTAENLMRMISGKQALGGVLGERIEALRPRFRGMLASEQADEIKWIIDESDLTIYACDWGWCVYREETSRCEGSHKGPNESRRSPSTCASCANLLVEQQHLPYWKTRRDRNSRLLTQLPENSMSRAVIQERVDESRRIIDSLIPRRH